MGSDGNAGNTGPKVKYKNLLENIMCMISWCLIPLCFECFYANQGSSGKRGELGPPGVKGHMVRFHNVMHTSLWTSILY